MHCAHPLQACHESTGLFASTLQWLRDRNRLHCPSPVWTKACGPGGRLAKASSHVQVTAAIACGTPPASPRYNGLVPPSSAPPHLTPTACSAAAAVEAVGAPAAAATLNGCCNDHANGHGGWARRAPGGDAGTAPGDWPLVSGGTHHHDRHYQRQQQQQQRQLEQRRKGQRLQHQQQQQSGHLQSSRNHDHYDRHQQNAVHQLQQQQHQQQSQNQHQQEPNPQLLLVDLSTLDARRLEELLIGGGAVGGKAHAQEAAQAGAEARPSQRRPGSHGGALGRPSQHLTLARPPPLGSGHAEGASGPAGPMGAQSAAAAATSLAVARSAGGQAARHQRRPSLELPACLAGCLDQPHHRQQQNEQVLNGLHTSSVLPPSPPVDFLSPLPPTAAHAFADGVGCRLPAAAAAAPRLGGAALSAAIRDAATLDELVDLYGTHQDGFRSGHVSAALGQLPHAAGLRATGKPRLAARRYEALLAQLLARFEAHRVAGEYGTRDLSGCAWVLGTLGRRELAGLVAELATHMLALRRRHLAAAGGGVAQPPPRPGRASDCSPLDLSSMALGMAKAGVTSPALWEGLAEAAEAAPLERFGPQETANLAWSLAQAHREYCRRESADGSSCMPPEASEPGGDGSEEEEEEEEEGLWDGFVAWPAGGGGASPPPAAPRALHPAWRPWASDFVEGVLAPRVRGALRLASPQQAANAAWALAVLGHGDARTLAAVAAAAGAAAAPQARRRPAPPLTPQGVCTLVWAMATMVATKRSSGSGAGLVDSRSNGAHCGDRRGGSGDATGSSSGGSDGGSTGTSTSSAASDAASCNFGPRQGSSSNNSSSRTSSGDLSDARRSNGDASEGNVDVDRRGSVARDAAAAVTAVAVTSPPGLQSNPPLPPPEPTPTPDPSPPSPPPPPALPFGPAVNPNILLALVRVAAGRAERLTGQGLSNLLWGLGVLGFRSPREVLDLAAREALLRLPEMRPLGLTTLVEEWARARRHHPQLFVAAAQLATAQLRDGEGDAWRPRTLARLLRAYGAMGHVDRRLFLAAAAVLAPGGAAAAAGSAPLDDLSPAELYQLACAYGRVGAHAPRLMDELLARLAPALTAAAATPPPSAAGRLLCALAVLRHRSAAADAIDTVRAMRRSVLHSHDGLSQMTSRHALAAVWALTRLRAARAAPAVLRMARLLARRAAPSATSLAAGLAAVARTPTVRCSPQALARLVSVLGRGAAAAAADAERLRTSAAVMVAAPSAAADAVAESEAEAAAGVVLELGWSLLAVARELLGKEDGPEEGGGALSGEVLVALAEALAEVLATAPPPPPHGAGSSVDVNVGANGAAARLYDMSYSCFLAVAEWVLRRGAAASSTPPPPQQQQPLGRLAARDLAAFVHAMYDSGVVASKPAMRAAAARQVLYRLQAAAAAAGAAAAGAPTDAPGSPPGAPAVRVSLGGGSPAQRPQRTNTPPSAPAQQHQRRHQQPLSPPPPPPRLSIDDLARLLAAAARLGLFEHPLAQPLLRDAASALLQSAPAPALTPADAALSGAAVTAAAAASGAGADEAAAAGATPAAALSPLGTAALQDLLRHCWWPASQLDDVRTHAAGPAMASSRVGGGGGGEGRSALSLGGRPPPDGDGRGDAAAADGLALRRAVYDWAARQALPVLPWLDAEVRVRVLGELRPVPGTPERLVRGR